MSRHEINTETIRAIVGWDQPLNSYFVQVWDRTKHEDDPAAELVWIGCGYQEITDLDEVRRVLAPWVKLPDQMVRALYAEAHS